MVLILLLLLLAIVSAVIVVALVPGGMGEGREKREALFCVDKDESGSQGKYRALRRRIQGLPLGK